MKHSAAVGITALLIVGCGETDAPSNPSAVPAPVELIEDVGPAIPVSDEPMAAFDAALAALIGADFADLDLLIVDMCVGNFDGLSRRFEGERTGYEGFGWGWDTAAETPAKQVLVVDDEGVIQGGLTGTIERADVVEVRSEITTSMVGWLVQTETANGQLNAYLVDMDAGTACFIGQQVIPVN